ncbi:MAG: right-handed parallel beta-helix repeat-containing protein [Pseudomonadota bacterium]|nr:right-handed parallel beta-helix repeat-containing protein [Pseudomonadota bacterium]
MLAPGDDVAAALAAAPAGGEVRLAPGEHRLAASLVLDRPVTLAGEPGARLVGDARDALIRVSAAVRLDGLEIARVGGWGSLIVVKDGAMLDAERCRLLGASSAWLLAERPTLEPDEAWMGAGVDVRGGHARLGDCHVEGPGGYGVAASGALPREVSIEGGRLTACLAGVRATGLAGVRVEGVVIDACVGAGVEVGNEGRVRLLGGAVSGGGIAAVFVDGGRAELVGVRIAAPAGSCLWAQGAAEVTAREAELVGAAASGVVARGRAKVTLERCRVSGVALNGLEALDAADIVATETTVEATSATAMATLTGTVRMERCPPAAPGEWEAYSGGAGRVDLGRPATGKVEEAVPAKAAEWEALLAAAALPPADREAVATRLHGRVKREPLAAWRGMGPPGLAALDRMTLGERVQHDVGAVTFLAWTEEGGVLAGRKLARLGPDLRARWTAPLDARPLGVFAGAGRLWAVLEKRGGSDVLAAWDDADGHRRGAVSVDGEFGAVRVDGDDVVIWGWDTSGHPTDRCSWRVTGSLGAGLGRPEVLAQGPVPAPWGERWDWVRGANAPTILPSGSARARGGAWLPGRHRAVVDTGAFVVTVDVDGLVWLMDTSGAPLAVRAPHPAARLLVCRDADVVLADADGGVRAVTIRAE